MKRMIDTDEFLYILSVLVFCQSGKENTFMRRMRLKDNHNTDMRGLHAPNGGGTPQGGAHVR